MKNTLTIALPSLLLLLLLSSCGQAPPPQTNGDYWLSVEDSATNQYSYVDEKGTVVVAPGKYLMNFTDTFRSYAIVAIPDLGFAGIDRKENMLYQVFPYDNGPDAPSEGLFRIVKDGKIGYADFKTGEVVVSPQYPCAWPFEGGKAKVATDCRETSDGEHKAWESDDWFFIDKSGKRMD